MDGTNIDIRCIKGTMKKQKAKKHGREIKLTIKIY